MKEFVEKLIKKLYENVKSSSCPSESCWEHSNKDCDKCNLKKIMISDVIEIVNQLAEEYKPKTNAGKIRNMSDEELAEFLGEFEVCNVCKYLGDRGECELDSIFLCEKGFAVAIAKDWLQSEVKGSDV